MAYKQYNYQELNLSRFTILDPKQHQDIKINTTRGAKFGENTHFIPVIADELKALVAEYAVCFLKNNETGQFGIGAITGFEPNENLYLQDDNWNARYVPLHVVRQPFMVGINGQEGEEANQQNTVITIELDNKRVSRSEGEPIFDQDGKSTQYLDHISQMLSSLIQGIPRTEHFIKSLLKHELLMPAKLDFTLANGEQKSFTGLYSIDEEKLSELSGDDLQNLHQKGYLQACHLVIASFGQIQKLIDWKNKA
jgi:hypothetical protein